MSSMSWLFTAVTEPRASADKLIKDHRERLAFEQHQQAERRRQELSEQSSSLNTPPERIRLWEKVHGLRLPRDPSHPVLDVVAAATGLTLTQVREEQQSRGADQTATPA